MAASVALVTGGSSGLGAATVRALMEAGARVCVLDLQSRDDGGLANVEYVKGSVTSTEDVQRALDICKKKYGGLNWLVNCAGRSNGGPTPTYDHNTKQPADLQNFIDCMMVNTVGTFNCSRLAAALMSENTPDGDGGRGVIVNVSSIIGIEGDKCVLPYSTSKAAVNGMTLPMARDLAPLGIRVVTIAPGFFETPMTAHTYQKKIQIMCDQMLQPKRMGKPEEFARLALEILRNPMINGEVIRIDAGARFQFIWSK